MSEIKKFIKDQLSVWPMAAANFRALRKTKTRTIEVGGLEAIVQFNPGRVSSSTFNPGDEKKRVCFLCEETRPKEQTHLKFEGRKGKMYNIQVNPFPVFPDHLVIAFDSHAPQSIWHHYVDMLDFTRRYPEFTVFYNGPESGASAPDHLHFQACPRGIVPIEKAADAFLDNAPEPLESVADATIYSLPVYSRGVYVLKATTAKSIAKLFYTLLDCVPVPQGEQEPRFNFFVWTKGDEWRTVLVLRSNLRSHHYDSTNPEEHLTMSPGCADMGGMFIAPVEDDFKKLNSRMLTEMVDEVLISKEDDALSAWRLTRNQEKIIVPVMSGVSEADFEIISDGAGPQRVKMYDGKISYNGMLYDELYFDAVTRSTVFAVPSFILNGSDGPQKFAGSIRFAVENGTIIATNKIGIENFIIGVLSKTKGLSYDQMVHRAREIRSAIAKGSPVTSFGYNGIAENVCPDVFKAVDLSWGSKLD